MELGSRELATVLAALRAWQSQTGHHVGLEDVSTNGGTLKALSDAEIDDLCERLNSSPDDSSDADPERSAEILHLAKEQIQSDGALEIDDDSLVSEGDDNGAYVQAWCWVDFTDTPLDKRNDAAAETGPDT